MGAVANGIIVWQKLRIRYILKAFGKNVFIWCIWKNWYMSVVFRQGSLYDIHKS